MIQKTEAQTRIKVDWCAVTERSPLYTIPRGTVNQLRGENMWRNRVVQTCGAILWRKPVTQTRGALRT